MAPTIGTGPFTGVRILELTTGTAGRTAGMLLADFGAEVARAEVPAQSPSDPRAVCWDRGKTLLGTETGPGDAAVELRRLAENCDVLLSDARPGELERRGLDAATLGSANPGIVHAWLPPYAARGRWSALPEDPLLLAAIGGFAAHFPASDERPVAPVVPTVSYIHGALGATAVAAALAGGGGRAVTVTGLHAAAAAQGTMMMAGLDVERIFSAGKILGGAPNFRAYRAGDGRWLFLAALTPGFFFEALDAVGRMDLLVREDVGGEFTNILKPEIGRAVAAELADTFAQRPAEHWLSVLAESGVPSAPVSSREEWMDSEVVALNRARADLTHPALGAVTMPGVPVALSASPGGIRGLATTSAAHELWRTPREGAKEPQQGPPLAGTRVLDLATFLAAPFVSSILADFGAQVDKIEPPEGDPYRVYSASFAAVNQGKSLANLDLRSERGRETFLRLAAGADVLVDNLRPASLDRLGLGEEVLTAGNPALVRCSVSAYGRTGAWADLPGFDPVVQALSGMMLAQGGPGQPVASTAPVNDVATGALAAFGVLAALFDRHRHGRAQHVTASLAATSTFLQSAELTTFDGRPPAAEGGADFAGPDAGHRLYQATDGWLAVATDDTAALARAAGRSTVDKDTFARRTVGEWLDVLTAHGVPACRVLAAQDELADPFLVENEFSHVVHVPDLGRVRVVRGYSDWVSGAAPAPGPR
ncbi:CoA transferase [Amycolatopsis sp.]|uniref:CaiB/BaiF CoA-transferase family protein n=1 Tax=Amycolatopsis sp. TaxID=37632 RepID=UPI002BDA3119|nr:CoA transferase [Amycolatopsis sp.]HVV08093.1 CoA transferase [Amycolatopsis sp.]